MWIILHSLTGKPEPFNADHMVRVYEFDGPHANIATADGKLTIVNECVSEVMNMLTRAGETLHAS